MLAWASLASAQEAPRPIVAFGVRGPSKLTDETAGYLAHVAVGERITSRDLPRITEALLSSELFEQVTVTLEPVADAVVVVCTLLLGFDVGYGIGDKSPAMYFELGLTDFSAGYRVYGSKRLRGENFTD